MRKPAMTPDAFTHRGTVAPFTIGLALVAGAGMMIWGFDPHSLSFASESRMTIDDRVAVLTAELAQVKAETAKLRDGQGDTSAELAHIRAGLANAEIGLSSLRTTTDENEARRRDSTAQIEQNIAQLKEETLGLRLSQDDTATELSSLRAGVANSEIGVASLHATTNEIRQRIKRMETIKDATGSIGKSHKHPDHTRWAAQP
ncbi:conserved hypothetical protein [Bradyrhizobium sp. STM 3843]|uniref:hypothetical protein n=1 Tax=Bradyrhizobium sp. STM 3843 TaxID=551947 RepID=UPI00024042E5|nr:hypothetical protein [Bradyrhizobium sp. STM 3843]CCE07949.1 conserved hypothetical protein [Bradyrhizobium sp. STM 3843]